VNYLKQLLNLIRTEPAVILFGVNTAVALAVSWGWHLTADQTGAITVITTAVLSILTAVLVREVSLPVIKGGLTSVLIALGAFHLHFSPSAIGSTTAAVSIVLGLLLRQNLTPLAKLPAKTPAP